MGQWEPWLGLEPNPSMTRNPPMREEKGGSDVLPQASTLWQESLRLEFLRGSQHIWPDQVP